MNPQETSRWRIALNMKQMDDAQRANELAGIQKVAQQSTLMQIAAIAASYAALGTKGTALATQVAAAAANEKLYRSSIGARDVARGAFDLELHTLKTLVEDNATSGGDVTGMGFTLLTPVHPSQAMPDPPQALLVILGKVHGKARVTVAGKGYLGRFVAEVSTDPIGPTTWSPLPGTGKQRKLSGYPSGTKLWVHFAAVRFGLQSAWSVPVLVTIP